MGLGRGIRVSVTVRVRETTSTTLSTLSNLNNLTTKYLN